PRGPPRGLTLAGPGPGPEAPGLLATAARSAAAHHAPGTARFVLSAPDDDCRPLAEALAAELAGRHPVETVDVAGLLAAVDATEPAYLVVFGLDVPSPEQLPPERLRALLREGPPAGRHLLGRWRTAPSFAALLEPDGEVDKLAVVAVVDLPGAQLASVFGRPVEWRPRPGRAVLWDWPGEQGTVLVPFAEQGEPT
ncbi:cell division protein FtsK, partial [Micromonospora sp. NPDC000018]